MKPQNDCEDMCGYRHDDLPLLLLMPYELVGQGGS